MGKTIAIFMLVVTAMLLAGVTVQSLVDNKAQAQGGRLTDYALISVAIDSNSDAACVVDTVTQRMLFFAYDQTTKKFEVMPQSTFQLRKDFGETKP